MVFGEHAGCGLLRIRLGDLEQAIAFQRPGYGLLYAGRPSDGDLINQRGICEAEVKWMATLREITGLTIVDLGKSRTASGDGDLCA